MNKNEFIIMRHSYDDHSILDGKNDTGLTENGIKIAESAAESLLNKIDDRLIVIRYSSKIRARQTAEIVYEALTRRGMPVVCVEDRGLTELYQGKFDFAGLSHEQRVDFLQSCWDDFEFQRENGNLKHRFGEFKNREIVVDLGENHAEWSARVGQAVLNILDEIKKGNQVLGITHRGATFEINNIVKMANGTLSSKEVESYKTIRMKYCQDFLLSIDNIEFAKKKVKEFIDERSM